jgi:chromosome segregation ATPase
MFNKLFIKNLKKRFNKFSPEEKQYVREVVNEETTSGTTEKPKVNKEKGTMENEKEIKTTTEETEKVADENNKVAEKTEETKTEEKVEEKTEEKNEETETPNEETEKEETVVEQTTEPDGNGIRVEDLVTKEMLADKFAALEAKFDAVLKENADLKEKLSNANKEVDDMKDKYENKDFGNTTKRGVMEKDKHANSSFEEYSKAFM